MTWLLRLPKPLRFILLPIIVLPMFIATIFYQWRKPLQEQIDEAEWFRERKRE